MSSVILPFRRSKSYQIYAIVDPTDPINANGKRALVDARILKADKPIEEEIIFEIPGQLGDEAIRTRAFCSMLAHAGYLAFTICHHLKSPHG